MIPALHYGYRAGLPIEKEIWKNPFSHFKLVIPAI